MNSAMTQPAKKGPPWLLIISGALALIAVLLCGFGGFVTFGGAKGLADATPITGTHTIDLDEGESISVWSEVNGNTCTATDPSGAPVSDSGVGSQTVTWGDKELHRVMKVEATQAGDHTITCTLPFVVSDGVSVSGIAFASVGGAICCIAVVLFVVGLVVWLGRRKR